MVRFIKWVGILEIIGGLLLITSGSGLMIFYTISSESDVHSYGLAIAIFGASIGGLMAFAGAVTLFKNYWGIAAQLPFLLYLSVISYIFLANYA